MKVLLLFPMADGQTGPAIKLAFEKIGHVVEAVDAKRHPLLSYSISCGFKPDLVFCSRTSELTEQVAQIKKRFPDAVTCMWNVDTRKSLDDWSHLFPLVKLVDYHFIVDYNFIKLWSAYNSNTFWLPQGVQGEVYNKPRGITAEDRQKYTCDVCFCGGRTAAHSNRRVHFLGPVERMNVDFKQWGCLGAPRIFNEEHNKMVACSKINLGCSGYPMAGRCVSVRNYKILGAGGFLLADYGDGVEELFPCADSERVLDIYRTPEEIVEKIKYWLSHEDERREIAEKGYKWVHAHARYEDRIKTALNYMKERLN